MNLLDAPEWILKQYPASENMRSLAERLRNIIPDIEPYLEDSFCKNHFRADLSEAVRDKKFWEGCWHLHVLFELRILGLKLKKPTTNDDIIVEIKGSELAIEVTFSGWGGPNSPLMKTNKNMRDGFAWIGKHDDDIVAQAMKVLDSKNQKLSNRSPRIPRIVALNEVLLTSGFPQWNLNTNERRLKIVSNAKARRYQGIDGLIYEFISYADYFKSSNITRCFIF